MTDRTGPLIDLTDCISASILDMSDQSNYEYLDIHAKHNHKNISYYDNVFDALNFVQIHPSIFHAQPKTKVVGKLCEMLKNDVSFWFQLNLRCVQHFL